MEPATARVPSRPVEDHAIYDLQYRRHTLPVTALAQELGLFSLLETSPMSLADLAATLCISARACEVLITVCMALGFLERHADATIALTATACTYLLPSSPFCYGPLLPPDDPALATLRRAVHAAEHAGEQKAVNMGALPLDQVRAFIRRMHLLALPAATALAEQPSFAAVRRLLDVGGGSGALSCAVAQAHPTLRATLMDLTPVCEVARELIAGYGLGTRVHCVVADMLRDPWPREHDAILFGNIFHDWEDATCRVLARQAAAALQPGGRVFLHEMLLDEQKDGPLTVACFSVNMLLYERGRQYTARELCGFLEDAGFIDCRSTPTFGYYHLIEAHKP